MSFPGFQRLHSNTVLLFSELTRQFYYPNPHYWWLYIKILIVLTFGESVNSHPYNTITILTQSSWSKISWFFSHPFLSFWNAVQAISKYFHMFYCDIAKNLIKSQHCHYKNISYSYFKFDVCAQQTRLQNYKTSDTFRLKLKDYVSGGVWVKDRGSPKSSGFILWRPLVPHLKTALLILKWWNDWWT